jgi:hypothetical protein
MKKEKFFERLIQEGKSLSKIAKNMNREENSIKNHYYRKCRSQETVPSVKSNGNIQEEIKSKK